MSDEETKLINNPLSFEERVLARLESVDSRLAALEKQPGFERLHNDFREMTATVERYLKNFDRKLDVVNNELLQVKVDQRALEDRVSRVEVEYRPQVVTQDKGF